MVKDAIVEKDEGSGGLLQNVGQNPIIEKESLENPMYGLFSDVFEQMGGVDRMKVWAAENYGEFMKLYVRLAPAANRGGGQINIQVNANLGPSPLDE